MWIRLLKVLLGIPFVLLMVVYYILTPLWFVIFNRSGLETTDHIESLLKRYERWK